MHSQRIAHDGHRRTNAIGGATRSFARSEGGGVASIFAISLVAVLGMAGMAVDGIRWSWARTHHAQVIDNALLSGARAMQLNPGNEAAALTAASEFYKANLKERFGIKDNTVTFQIVDGGKAIGYSGDARIDVTLMKVLGFQKLSVTTPAKAAFGTSVATKSNVELALMLDVTGSMCSDGTGPCASSSKLDGVRKAADGLAMALLSTQASGYTSRMALIPFSSIVRVGPDGGGATMMNVLTGMPSTASISYTQCTAQGANQVNGEFVTGGACTATKDVVVPSAKLNPCVTERMSGSDFDPSDTAPGPGRWLNGQGGDRSPSAWNYNEYANGCVIAAGNEIVPLTTSLSRIKDRLASMVAYGSTAGALGTVFTQYVLSPNWSGVWASSERPGSYADTKTLQRSGAPVLRKIAILMSDGAYNTMLQWERPVSEVSRNALAACDAMKKNGIEIYSVGFDLASLSSAERQSAVTVLKSCASTETAFYQADTVDQLIVAFRDIGGQVAPIRLTQ